MLRRVGLFWHLLYEDGNQFGWEVWVGDKKIGELEPFEPINTNLPFRNQWRYTSCTNDQNAFQKALEAKRDNWLPIRFENRKYKISVPYPRLDFAPPQDGICELRRDYRNYCLPPTILELVYWWLRPWHCRHDTPPWVAHPVDLGQPELRSSGTASSL